jgi:hypothetical protein
MKQKNWNMLPWIGRVFESEQKKTLTSNAPPYCIRDTTGTMSRECTCMQSIDVPITCRSIPNLDFWDWKVTAPIYYHNQLVTYSALNGRYKSSAGPVYRWICGFNKSTSIMVIKEPTAGCQNCNSSQILIFWCVCQGKRIFVYPSRYLDQIPLWIILILGRCCLGMRFIAWYTIDLNGLANKYIVKCLAYPIGFKKCVILAYR